MLLLYNAQVYLNSNIFTQFLVPVPYEDKIYNYSESYNLYNIVVKYIPKRFEEIFGWNKPTICREKVQECRWRN